MQSTLKYLKLDSAPSLSAIHSVLCTEPSTLGTSVRIELGGLPVPWISACQPSGCSAGRPSSPIKLGPWPRFVKVGKDIDIVESRLSVPISWAEKWEDSLGSPINGNVLNGRWNCRDVGPGTSCSRRWESAGLVVDMALDGLWKFVFWGSLSSCENSSLS